MLWTAAAFVLMQSGWTHFYDQHVRIDATRIVLHAGDGRELYFDVISPGQSTRNHAEKLDLSRHADFISIHTQQGLMFIYSPVHGRSGSYPLTRIEDRSGNNIRLSYDAYGHLTKITDSVGRAIHCQNDNFGRLTYLRIPHPNQAQEQLVVARFEYDANGDLVTVYDALDQPFCYQYKFHLLIREINRNGLSFYFAYDGIDKDAYCVRTWGDGGIYDHVLTYDKLKNVTIVENSLGNKTTYICSGAGIVTNIIDPLGNKSSRMYDEFFRITKEVDELSLITAYEYDERGNCTKIIRPNGSELTVVFNDKDQPIQAVDFIGGVWMWKYNRLGRLIGRTDSLNRETRFRYDGKLLSELIDPAGQKTILNYDYHGNLISLIEPNGAITTWQYDRLGRCVSVTDPKGNTQRNVFDLLGRITHVQERDGNIREQVYDAEGHITKAKDRSYEVFFEYGGMGRMTARIQSGTRVEFVYDTEQQLIGIRNAHGVPYLFEPDPNGRTAAEIDFYSTRRAFIRDAKGRVKSVLRADITISRYKYDVLDNVMKVEHSDGYAETFVYRPDGELMEASNPFAKIRFERDMLGRITKEWLQEHWVASKYDVFGRRVDIQSSFGISQKIQCNQVGAVEKISLYEGNESWPVPWEVRFTRDQMGLELERMLPGGIKATYQRDAVGRPVSHTVYRYDGLLRKREYQWDVNDRLQYIVDSLTGTTYFHHDLFGNLISAQESNGENIFRISDAVGNLFRTEDRSDRIYGAAGQLLKSLGPKGWTSYEYDAEGNFAKKIEPDNREWIYRWNGVGMLTKVIRPDGEIVEFEYDPLSRRLCKKFKGQMTHWAWDGNKPLHEWIEKDVEQTPADAVTSNTPDSDDIRARRLDAMLAGYPANGPPTSPSRMNLVTWIFEPGSYAPLAKIANGRRYGIVADNVGVPVAMFDGTGTVTWAADLNIYGEVKHLKGNKDNCPFRFPGQYEDEETGLYYNRFRYYDPETGRFISQDPIGLQAGFSPYAYVKSPAWQKDPLGLFNEWDVAPYGQHKGVGDGLDAHELLQSKWLREHGFGDRASAVGKENPAIAIDPQLHKQINADQRAAGLYDTDTILKQTAQENIDANAKILQARAEQKLIAEGMNPADAARIAEQRVSQMGEETEAFAKKHGCM